MVGVDKDRKEKVVGEMIQREVPLMTSPRFGYMPLPVAVNSSLLVVTVQCARCMRDQCEKLLTR